MILCKDNVERIANDPTTIAELKALGYHAITTDTCFEQDEEKTSVEAETSLDALSVKELRNMAKSRGIKGVASLNRSNLIDILQG